MSWRNYPKYHSKKVQLDGMTFDSKREAERYIYLKLLQKAGEISDLRCQVEYELIPNQYGADVITPTGKKKRGKLLERAVKYKADFTYIEDGELIVEDVKGFKTKDYILKRKMMLFFHGIRIKET